MQTQDLLAVSASMRTALLVYSGITREDDGRLRPRRACCRRCSWCSTSRTAWPARTTTRSRRRTCSSRARSRRPSTATPYVLGPGDVAWAGVGCVHGFRNVGDGPVRWLETQAPQPPARHSYRFARDWDYLRDRLGGDVMRTVVIGGTSGHRAGGRPRTARPGATTSCSPAATCRAPTEVAASVGIRRDRPRARPQRHPRPGRRAGRRRRGRPARASPRSSATRTRSPTTTSTGPAGSPCSSWSATPRSCTRC